MRCVQSSPPRRCLMEPLIAERWRHHELEKKSCWKWRLAAARNRLFVGTLLSKHHCRHHSMLPRFVGSRGGVSERHPTDLAS
jgi:hypothetical protein